MVLHYLAELLALSGERVRLFPCIKQGRLREFVSRYLGAFLLEWMCGYKRPPNASIFIPTARRAELRESIAVYSEIVDNNPLKSRHVVRWLLHQPGFHTGKINYGRNELHFYYQPAFNFTMPYSECGGELSIVKLMTNIYYEKEAGSTRTGRCYILRKGRSRVPDRTLLDGVIVDDLDHVEIARIFNSVEYCISYDAYTFYSIYAALCGCKSIIVPLEGITKERWQPLESLRYGLAYGEADLKYAKDTISSLRALLQKRECENRQAVSNFVRKCEDYFG